MSLPIAILAGLAAGLAASAITETYQSLAAPLFGQKASDEPATVKAADSAKQAAGAGPVAKKHRSQAGRGVHYATGLALGLLYAVIALYWPPVTIGFGIVFGIAAAVVLDYVAVPASAGARPHGRRRSTPTCTASARMQCLVWLWKACGGW